MARRCLRTADGPMSSEEPVSSTELALLIAMIAVFVAALLLVSRYDPAEADSGG